VGFAQALQNLYPTAHGHANVGNDEIADDVPPAPGVSPGDLHEQSPSVFGLDNLVAVLTQRGGDEQAEYDVVVGQQNARRVEVRTSACDATWRG
jgi:hypothetical protein